MRFLGIDYGHKRIGLSYADSVGIALPLDAAVAQTPEERLEYIGKIILDKKITALIIGYPYHMDGSASQKTKEVDEFIEKLRNLFSLPVYTVDETLTSHTAQSFNKKKKTIRDQKMHRQTGKLDSQAATLILQDYLDQHMRF